MFDPFTIASLLAPAPQQDKPATIEYIDDINVRVTITEHASKRSLEGAKSFIQGLIDTKE